jgi:hypothetical protein
VPRLTRRRALEVAGAATAAAALRPGLASAASFSQDVPLPADAAISGRRTLAAVRAPQRFALIGLDFGRAGHVHAELRARRDGGRWSAWTPVHDATQPVWTGPADVYQVRFTGGARRLTARLVHVAGAPRTTALAARKSGGKPHIIPRSGWGGGNFKTRAAPTYGVVQLGFVHHTVTANDYAPGDSAGIVLGIAHYHRDHNGWNDIGYNFLADKYGQLFEGRAGGEELAVIGAQAQGYNSHSTGISCLGDYTSGQLPVDGIDAVSRLLAWKLSLHRVPVTGRVTVVSEGGSDNRYRSGAKVTLQRISGHRDGDATACPGSALYAQLATIRSRADDLAVPLNAVTIAVSETALRYPHTTLTLSGTLSFADDANPTALPVQVSHQPAAGEPWTVLGTLTADFDGNFSGDFDAPGSGRIRAAYAGDATHPEFHSAPITVTVTPKLRLSVAPRTVAPGTQAVVSATVGPVSVTSGRLVIERRSGSRYKRVSTQRITLVDGGYQTGFTPSRPGTYRIAFTAGGQTIRRLLHAVTP